MTLPDPVLFNGKPVHYYDGRPELAARAFPAAPPATGFGWEVLSRGIILVSYPDGVATLELAEAGGNACVENMRTELPVETPAP